MSIIELANYLLKASVCLLLLYSFYLLILKNQHCFKFNRFYIITALLFSLILPSLKVFTFTISKTSSLDLSVFIMPELLVVDHRLPSSSFTWYNAFLILYTIVVLFMAMRLVYNLIKITGFIIANKAKRVPKFGYYLINTNGAMPTSSFFNYILWDNTVDLTQNERSHILKHEQTHVFENHSLDIILFELSLIFFWFNPILWFMKKSAIENHEFLADYSASDNINFYTKLLAKYTLVNQGIPVTHTFKTAEVFKRLKMLKMHGKKTPIYKYVIVIIALSFTFFSMSFNIDKSYLNNINNTNVKQEPIQNNYEISNTEVFSIVEQPAQPVGGMSTFYSFVKDVLIYPENAKIANIEGRVFIEFIVEKDGAITNTKILKGIDPECDVNALEVMSNLKNWIPAKQDNKLVRQKIVLPISFKLK